MTMTILLSTMHLLPQSVPAPVLQLDDHTLPGDGGLAIVGASSGAQAVALATLRHAPRIVRVTWIHHHGITRSSVLFRG